MSSSSQMSAAALLFDRGLVEELRLTCVGGIPAVQRRVDAVSASFRKSLETTKSRVRSGDSSASSFSLFWGIASPSSLPWLRPTRSRKSWTGLSRVGTSWSGRCP